MRDITLEMNHYREAARILWNNFLCTKEVQFDTVEVFDRIRAYLFTELVLKPLGVAPEVRLKLVEPWLLNYEPTAPIQFIEVVPIADSIPIHVSRGDHKRGYWDEAVEVFKRSEGRLLYLDCFDWDLRSYRTFHYYLVELRDARTESLEGRSALVVAEHVRGVKPILS